MRIKTVEIDGIIYNIYPADVEPEKAVKRKYKKRKYVKNISKEINKHTKRIVTIEKETRRKLNNMEYKKTLQKIARQIKENPKLSIGEAIEKALNRQAGGTDYINVRKILKDMN